MKAIDLILIGLALLGVVLIYGGLYFGSTIHVSLLRYTLIGFAFTLPLLLSFGCFRRISLVRRY